MIVKVAVISAIICVIESLPYGRSWKDDVTLHRSDHMWDGRAYSFEFSTLFGTSRKEKAILEDDDFGGKYLNVVGEYTAPVSDDLIRRVTYSANKNGYREHAIFEARDNHIQTMHEIDGIHNLNKTRIVSQQLLDINENAIKTKYPSLSTDEIIFPNDNKYSTTETTVLTTSSMSIAPAPSNETSMDYYYDELGNRIGGVPPAVLGSLLG